MSNLYLTSDRIGVETGGGIVTAQESQALQTLGPCEVWGRNELKDAKGEDPWLWDNCASNKIAGYSWGNTNVPKLTHIYAGTFSKSIRWLMDFGGLVSVTAAAHSIEKSRRAHLELGFDFDRAFPHLVDPELWERYVRGYQEADVVICPSKHSAECMIGYGCKNIEIIPHGVTLPSDEEIAPLPKTYTVGYLGSFGADKSVITLLKAWKQLAYRDALLVLAGKDSKSDYVQSMVRASGCSNVIMTGWVDHPGDFYNNLSIYVQPSRTEGFGIETLEAMSYSRVAVCSDGAGASDLSTAVFNAGDVDGLASWIDHYRIHSEELLNRGQASGEKAKGYSWDIIRQKYIEVWKRLLG